MSFQPSAFQTTAFQTTAPECPPDAWGGSWGMSWGESWGCQVTPPTPPVEVGSAYAVGGGGGKAGVDLEELEVFCKLKRLMDGGKSLTQSLALLDVEEKEEVIVPKKITPKMQRKVANPTVLAWVNQRIVTLERTIAVRQQDEDKDEEEAVAALLCHLL